KAAGVTGAPHLAAVVIPAGEPARTVDAGLLRRGEHEYRAALPACAAGCRLLGLALTRTSVGPGDAAMAAVVNVERIASGSGPLAAGFDSGRWSPSTSRNPSAQV